MLRNNLVNLISRVNPCMLSAKQGSSVQSVVVVVHNCATVWPNLRE